MFFVAHWLPGKCTQDANVLAHANALAGVVKRKSKTFADLLDGQSARLAFSTGEELGFRRGHDGPSKSHRQQKPSKKV
jgi:hypothetical protein